MKKFIVFLMMLVVFTVQNVVPSAATAPEWEAAGNYIDLQRDGRRITGVLALGGDSSIAFTYTGNNAVAVEMILRQQANRDRYELSGEQVFAKFRCGDSGCRIVGLKAANGVVVWEDGMDIRVGIDVFQFIRQPGGIQE